MAIFDDTGLGVSNDDVSDETNINDIVARLVTSFNVTVENRLATVEIGQSLSQQWAVADVGTLIIDNTTGVTIQGYSALAWGTEAKQWASNAQGTLVVLADGTASAEYSAKAQALAAKNWVSGTPGVSTEADGSTTIPYTAYSKALEAFNSAAAALVSEGNAATSEANALSYSGLAEGYKDDALSYKDLAQEWAENPEDVEITGYPGQFSALHWAAKATAIGIKSVTSTSPVTVDNTDPLNPIVGLDDSLYMAKTGNTGSAELPTGTTLERDVVPEEGYLRFNSDEKEAEIYNGTEWTSVGGGGLDWSPDAITTATTIEEGKGYSFDTTTTAFTATLPLSPDVGDTVGLSDAASNFSSGNLTVDGNGEKIMGLDEDLILDQDDQAVVLVYRGTDRGWVIKYATPYTEAEVTYPRKNYLHNPTGQVNQRLYNNGDPLNHLDYGVDRWFHGSSESTSVVDVFNGTNRSRGLNYFGVKVTDPGAIGTENRFSVYNQRLEGGDVFSLNGETCTLSFWTFCTKPGTYCFNIQVIDGVTGDNHLLIKEYEVSDAETWEKIETTFTIPDALIDTNTDVGLQLRLGLVCGSSYQNTTDVWHLNLPNQFVSSSNAVNWLDTLNNLVLFSQVKLEKGPNATPFVTPVYGEELALCQRYYYVGAMSVLYFGMKGTSGGATTTSTLNLFFPVTMRAQPTLSYNLNFATEISKTVANGGFSMAATATSVNAAYLSSLRADAEL